LLETYSPWEVCPVHFRASPASGVSDASVRDLIASVKRFLTSGREPPNAGNHSYLRSPPAVVQLAPAYPPRPAPTFMHRPNSGGSRWTNVKRSFSVAPLVPNAVVTV